MTQIREYASMRVSQSGNMSAVMAGVMLVSLKNTERGSTISRGS